MDPRAKIAPGTVSGLSGTALGAAGIHHHDRAHHHHVHDHLAPGATTGLAPGMTGTGMGTTGMAPGMTSMTPGMTTMAPGMAGTGMGTTGATGTRVTGLNEHQVIQDVIPPGRDRIVEHHEKY